MYRLSQYISDIDNKYILYKQTFYHKDDYVISTADLLVQLNLY